MAMFAMHICPFEVDPFAWPEIVIEIVETVNFSCQGKTKFTQCKT